jgi:enoyl-CoA hydratase
MSDTASDRPIIVSTPDEGVRCITLNRPDRLNAMNMELVEGLHDAFRMIADERDARVVILTGAGRGFCAGLDLSGYGRAPRARHDHPVPGGFAIQQHIASLVDRMRSMPQPIVAAVNGPAAGGGLALVLASDVRLAAASARFNVAFVRIGLSGCDIGTSWLLPRIVGAARAQEMMLTGRLIDAEEALRIGLVVEVTEQERLMELALAKAAMIIANAPFAVSLTKEGMWSALEIPSLRNAIDLENRQQILLGQTGDAREAQRAFLEKRPPHFTD